MKPILDKLLEKRGIQDVTALSPDEKETFEKWDRTLSEGNLTVKKIEDFCKAQMSVIEARWRREVADNSKEKNEKLMVMHTVYSTLAALIAAPQTEKENLEKYLKNLLDS